MLPTLDSARARRVLELANRDRREAARAMEELELDAQVALVCEAPLARRAELIGLAPNPEALVPALPEAELCFVLKHLGLHDCSWLLDLATTEQIATAVDLDAWQRSDLDRAQLGAWLIALAEASGETILRAARGLDPELVVLHLRAKLDVLLKPNDTEDPGWEPPPGYQTLEGQFYFSAKHAGDDAEAEQKLLRELFEHDYWTYYRFVQGAIWELDGENEEWALRWRNGRLQDLGFPDRGEALGIYRYLSPEERAQIPATDAPLGAPEFALATWIPSLPEAANASLPLFRAIAELDPNERRGAFYAFVGLANRVAVADGLPLSDADSMPRAIEKAARLADDGLSLLGREHGLGGAELLRRISLVRLFQIGANLDPERSRPVVSAPAVETESEPD
jgi:hypothetical protein